MTHSKRGCPDGWDPAELLAYLDGDAEPVTRAALEQHLSVCQICSDELDSLRRWDDLLRKNPEAFHPDAEDLYLLVARGEDPEGDTRHHVESCPDCTEAVQLLREMLSAETVAPERPPVIPASLVSRLERLHSVPGEAPLRESPFSFFERLLGMRLRVPVLALGTAAAVAIVAIVVLPRMDIFKEVSQPAAVAPIESSRGMSRPELRATRPGRSSLRDRQANGNEGLGQTPTGSEFPPQPSTPAHSLPLLQGKLPGQSGHPAEGDLHGLSAPTGAAEPHSIAAPAPPQPQLEKEVPRSQAPAGRSLKRKLHLGSGRMSKPGFSSPAAVPETGIPVKVQIVDGEGRPIPGLTVVSPKIEDHRFSFSGGLGAKKEMAGTMPMKSLDESAPSAVAEHEAQGYLVLVTVLESRGAFDLDAKLFRDPSLQNEAPISTIHARNVSKGDLPTKIGGLVFSLLQLRR